MRPIDADALRAQMYHEAFETDTDMQRWDNGCWIRYKMFENAIDNAPTIEPQRWIPVTEKLPEDLEAVNITWVNHEPEPYYHDIKDKNFVATGIHYRDKWYWYSTTCADFLGEYGSNEVDEVDAAVEIIAWMPLPECYKGGTE